MKKIRLEFLEKYKKDELTEVRDETANALPIYREYVTKLALKGKDAKSFSEWKEKDYNKK